MQRESICVLEQAGIENAGLDVALLLCEAMGATRESLLLNPDMELNDKEKELFRRMLERRLAHEPVAYILGRKEFWSLDFSVTRDTLIPRPDSETVVEAAIACVRNRVKPLNVLDLGTGSGCLLISVLTELPSAHGLGVDKNERALHIARRNAGQHGVLPRTGFVCGDWSDALNGTFDLILSNPPYIPEPQMRSLMPDVVDYEPRAALAAGADGLDAYRALAVQLAPKLAPGGHLLFEVGQGQAGDVSMLLEQNGFAVTSIARDLAGTPRCVVATGNASDLIVKQPLTNHKDDHHA